MIMTNKESRKQMSDYWGYEIVVQCCRFWKLHYGNGSWGNCGICRKRPIQTHLTWDEIDD